MALTDEARTRAAPGTPPRLLWSWLAWTTGGEAVGFLAPAAVASVVATLPAAMILPSRLLAGAVEGAVLGAAQAHVLRRVLPRLPGPRWVIATSLAAVLAWLIGLLPSTLGNRLDSWPVAVVIGAVAVGGTVLLLSIGAAQWTVLRRHVAHAGRWIAITAIGWLAGLTVFMLIATPLWQEGQPIALTIAIGVLAGLVMAATMAAVTGLGLERLLAAGRTTGRVGRV